jgi:integrase
VDHGGNTLLTRPSSLQNQSRDEAPGKDFVLHSLRHTFLTRLGEAGADAFTIMRIAGHSSVTVSQRYLHPTPEAVERAFERLETLNKNAGMGKLDLTTFATTSDFLSP